MSWHYLQGQEVESWEGNSLDGAPSALLRLIPTPAKCSSPVSEMASSSPSQSGTMCGPSTVSHGEAGLMSSRAGSPASGSPLPARKKASTTRTLPSGTKWPESLARFDPPTSSWKTPHSSLLEGWDKFSGTWPRSGLMRHGIVFPLRSWARLKPGKGSGLLPTLVKADGKGSRNGTAKGRTPSAGITVTDWLWLNIGPGMLHPESAEWMMLWPIGWTALTALGTDKFQEWFHSHSQHSSAA